MGSEAQDEKVARAITDAVCWALFVLYLFQIGVIVKRDMLQKWIHNAIRRTAHRVTRIASMSNPYPPVSKQNRYILAAGSIATALLSIRCIDPLGEIYYNNKWLHLLSFMNLAMSEVVSCFVLETFLLLALILESLSSTPSLLVQWGFRIISCLTILSAIVCGLVYCLIAPEDSKWLATAHQIQLAVYGVLILITWNISVARISRRKKALASARIESDPTESTSYPVVDKAPSLRLEGVNEETTTHTVTRSITVKKTARAIDKSLQRLFIISFFANLFYLLGIAFLIFGAIRNSEKKIDLNDLHDVYAYRFPGEYGTLYIHIAVVTLALWYSWQRSTFKLLFSFSINEFAQSFGFAHTTSEFSREATRRPSVPTTPIDTPQTSASYLVAMT